MSPRLDYRQASPGAFEAMLGLEQYSRRCGLEHSLLELVKTRVSQLNGCAFCLDMHTKDARAAGESEQRLHLLSVWRETQLFSPREQAALAWAEAVTQLGAEGVPDPVYVQALQALGEKGLVDLSLAVIAINGWNRLAIPFRSPAGSYQPPTAAHD